MTEFARLAAWHVREHLRRTPSRIFFIALRAFHPAEEYLGLRILLFLEADKRPRVSARVRDALDLIAARHPVLFQKVQRYLAAVVVQPAGYPEYRHEFRACFMSSRSVEQLDAAKLALLIVHEATHGRLFEMAVEGPLADRERIERVCVSQEIALARVLSDHDEDLVEFARKKLDLRWWEPEAVRARRNLELKRLWEEP